MCHSIGGGEMTQQAKCKNQDLSLDPQHLLKLGTVASIILELGGKQDKRISGSHWLTSLAKKARARGQEETMSQK